MFGIIRDARSCGASAPSTSADRAWRAGSLPTGSVTILRPTDPTTSQIPVSPHAGFERGLIRLLTMARTAEVVGPKRRQKLFALADDLPQAQRLPDADIGRRMARDLYVIR